MTRIASIPDAAAAAISEASARRGIAGLLSNYCQLTKARLSALVVLTSGAGFALGSGDTIHWTTMLWTMLGTALAAGSANIFNELWEIERDRRMPRTQSRPLPTGRIGPFHAMILGVTLGSAGLIILDIMASTPAATLALVSLVLYVAVYTPLKPRSTLNTLVGAVCGALPPMIGWVAAAGTFDPGAWILFGILYVWQLPHFFALAWLYREDYQRGGFVMLPAVDPHGELTGRVIVLTSAILIPLALALTLQRAAGLVYAGGALALGLLMLGLAAQFHKQRTNVAARKVFLASILYLPLLLALMVLDRQPHVPTATEPSEWQREWVASTDELLSYTAGSGVTPAIIPGAMRSETGHDGRP